LPDESRHIHFRPLGGNSADEETGITVFAKLFQDHNPYGQTQWHRPECSMCSGAGELIVVE
jgi:hypothetical protein